MANVKFKIGIVEPETRLNVAVAPLDIAPITFATTKRAVHSRGHRRGVLRSVASDDAAVTRGVRKVTSSEPKPTWVRLRGGGPQPTRVDPCVQRCALRGNNRIL